MEGSVLGPYKGGPYKGGPYKGGPYKMIMHVCQFTKYSNFLEGHSFF